MPGSHHFDENYPALITRMLHELPADATTPVAAPAATSSIPAPATATPATN
jgi:type IV secretory pathway VirJ component